jgi:DNA polymerase I-like protein with 3'-5' exonuclease and polymerase domains
MFYRWGPLRHARNIPAVCSGSAAAAAVQPDAEHTGLPAEQSPLQGGDVWNQQTRNPPISDFMGIPDFSDFSQPVDFSQQEIAVAAWLSQDSNLINAYNSGDVYLEFAKQAGAVPMDATKKTHERERDLFKSTKLGLQYGMGAEKLRLKLTYDCKRTVSLEETQALITAHKTVYAEYWNWVYKISKQYKSRVPLVTSDGWVLWTDNPIMTSVRNFHVQAHSASITRQAVVDACKANLKVMSSLHDALYIISQEPTKDLIILQQILRNATEKILGENCIEIRIDDKILTDSEIWVEKKGQADWSKIKTHII